MTFKIVERESGGISILDLVGKLTVLSADEVGARVGSLLGRSRQSIVMNLESLAYLDTTGLGALLDAAGVVSRAGGQLKLVGVTRRVESLLAITKLLTSFDTFESEREAIESFLLPST